MAWSDTYDQQYNNVMQMANYYSSIGDAAAAAQWQKQAQTVVSARNAEAARIASENDAWHKQRGTGPYTTAGGGNGGSATTPAAAFSAVQIMENMLYAATGISGLGTWASDLYNRGASPTEIISSLRYGTDTSQAGQQAYASYLAAFPKMDQFLKEGIFAGENPELQYISYRNTVKEAAQRYGVMDSLVSGDRIANYISNRTSAAEIVDRMGQAAQAVATTPVETFAILQDYYGINNGDLISFYLDPDTTEAILQRRYTAARIGTEAARQQFGINVSEAENLAQRGVTVDEANQGFAIAAQRSAFMQGRGETAGRSDIIGASFGDNEAATKVERIAKSRVGAFEAGGGFVQSERGVVGLGSATR